MNRASPNLDTDKSISFDPNDEVSFYYGNLSREQVKDILIDSSIGTFLIRDSTKDYDQKVLCVKEGPRVINNYKIVHKQTESDNRHVFFLFGKEDLLFDKIANILEFYSTHYLNDSPLTKPAFHHKKCIALHDFQENGDPCEDLYFKKGEILTILEYTQGDDWWKASNSNGQVGLVPVPLIRRLKPNEWPLIISNGSSQSSFKTENQTITQRTRNENEIQQEKQVNESQLQETVHEDETVMIEEKSKKCPFNVKVIEDYTPSPYEHSCISLRKGQIVTVLEMKSMGKWYGKMSDGKKGLFPFNRVEILDDQ